MSDKKTIHKERPFSNGSEYFDWKDENCDMCANRWEEVDGLYRCKYERAIDRAYFDYGLVRVDYLIVMGLDFNGSGRCSQFRSCDGLLIPGTVEYDKQHSIDMKKLENWVKGQEE